MKFLIKYIVKELVEYPDQVEITELIGEDSTTYEVRVDPRDIGKVIGKQGRIANAIRIVAKSVAMKHHKKAYVEIIIPESSVDQVNLSDEDTYAAQDLSAIA